MKIKTERLKLLNTVFSGYFDKLDIIPSEEGWNVYALSLDHVSMLKAHIASSAFDEYEVYPRFAIDVKHFTDGLKNMKETTELKMSDDYARLTFISNGVRMKIPLPMPYDTAIHVPNLNLKTGFVCNMDVFKNVIDIAKSNIIRFELDDKCLTISSLDETGCGPSMEIPVSELLSAEGNAKAGYSVDHFKAFLSKFPKNGVGSFEFDSDKPASVSFAIDEVEGAFLIAPMIEEEI